MTSLTVFGGGAFGTSLALALAQNGSTVTLYTRDAKDAEYMNNSRQSGKRLSGYALPNSLVVTASLNDTKSDVSLIAVPMQRLRGFLETADQITGTLVACCKGIDLETGLGAVHTLQSARPDCSPALLTGPSFAADIAEGLPTALTLAAENEKTASQLQEVLSRPALRLYRTDDIVGAELGGSLKNVIALAAGMAIGAGFGDSARASVIARGFAEMVRFALAKGGRPETLQGLSGLGDLVLTCTSEKSRNFAAGQRIGAGGAPDETTIEGIPTAKAISTQAQSNGIDMPITQAVADVTAGRVGVQEAVAALLSRPVRKE